MSILRKMFGPSREEIWRQLSDQIGGNYTERTFWKGDKVQASHGEWIVTLDVFTQVISTGKTTMVIPYTRLRAPYVNPDGFRFTICRRGLFSGIAQWFGMQDVAIGDEEFDRDFVIKGTDEGMLRALFANPKLRELIAGQPKINLTVKDNEGWAGVTFPENTDELYFVTGGIIKEVDRLKALFDLFGETLEQLCRIGAAYEEAAGVKL